MALFCGEELGREKNEGEDEGGGEKRRKQPVVETRLFDLPIHRGTGNMIGCFLSICQ